MFTYFPFNYSLHFRYVTVKYYVIRVFIHTPKRKSLKARESQNLVQFLSPARQVCDLITRIFAAGKKVKTLKIYQKIGLIVQVAPYLCLVPYATFRNFMAKLFRDSIVAFRIPIYRIASLYARYHSRIPRCHISKLFNYETQS